jgi:hypothetical protein
MFSRAQPTVTVSEMANWMDDKLLDRKETFWVPSLHSRISFTLFCKTLLSLKIKEIHWYNPKINFDLNEYENKNIVTILRSEVDDSALLSFVDSVGDSLELIKATGIW